MVCWSFWFRDKILIVIYVCKWLVLDNVGLGVVVVFGEVVGCEYEVEFDDGIIVRDVIIVNDLKFL